MKPTDEVIINHTLLGDNIKSVITCDGTEHLGYITINEEEKTWDAKSVNGKKAEGLMNINSAIIYLIRSKPKTKKVKTVLINQTSLTDLF